MLSFVDKKRIALGIAQGLKHLHSLREPKVIHGNLKPQNVLVCVVVFAANMTVGQRYDTQACGLSMHEV